jgi:hypothetical protein
MGGKGGKGREGKGRDGKGMGGEGTEGKGRGENGREGEGREGKGREGKGWEWNFPVVSGSFAIAQRAWVQTFRQNIVCSNPREQINFLWSF